jgi:hypothetical protein
VLHQKKKLVFVWVMHGLQSVGLQADVTGVVMKITVLFVNFSLNNLQGQ